MRHRGAEGDDIKGRDFMRTAALLARTSCIASAFFAVTTMPALAQEAAPAASASDDVIVVTARRRAETVSPSGAGRPHGLFGLS